MLKGLHTMISLPLKCKYDLTYANQYSIMHHTKSEGLESCGYLNKYRKTIWQNSMSCYNNTFWWNQAWEDFCGSTR